MEPELNQRRGVKAVAVLLTSLAVVAAAIAATSASSGDTKYKYDSLGRVVEVFYPDNTKITYAYDQAGNRTQAIAVLNATSSSASSSSGANVAPVCTSQSNTITGIPSGVTATVTITAAQITGLCSDANGDTLIVTVPATVPYSFTLNAASTVSTSYTVSDGRTPALTASNVITYIRP